MKEFIKALVPEALLIKYRALRTPKVNVEYGAEFKGDEVYCPICRSSFKVFAPHGLNKRTNARCHVCDSLERHRLLFLYLQKRSTLLNIGKKPLRLLHFAPERMFYDLFSNMPSIEYTPCDLFPEQYPYRGRAEIVKVDITQIPFAENSFDFILCNHVLEHVPDDRKAMAELYRVMAPNGNGIFQVPVDYARAETYEDWNITTPEEREKAFGQKDHVRWFGRDYVTRLGSVGFQVNEDHFVTGFSAAEQYKYGVSASELIYHCSK